MLVIKLQRTGRRHQPSYRIVVAERCSKLKAPPVEDLGFYDPRTKQARCKKERVSYWLKIGARPTASAHNLLVKEGAISGPKKAIKIKNKKEEKTG